MEKKTVKVHLEGLTKDIRKKLMRQFPNSGWPKGVNKERGEQNIVFKDESLKDAYHRIFDDALNHYNSNKSPSRRIPDYLDSILNGKQIRNCSYELLIQFGNSRNTEEDNETAVKMYKQYFTEFQGRNPHLEIIQAVIHLDEVVPNLHIVFVPAAPNNKDGARGLSIISSINKALTLQGFQQGETRFDSPVAKWTAAERHELDLLCEKYGYEIEHPQKVATKVDLDNLIRKNNDERAELIIECWNSCCESYLEFHCIEKEIDCTKEIMAMMVNECENLEEKHPSFKSKDNYDKISTEDYPDFLYYITIKKRLKKELEHYKMLCEVAIKWGEINKDSYAQIRELEGDQSGQCE